MKAIVYTSQTGFTQRYAKLLSEKTGVPAYSVKEAAKELQKKDDIFYMGWLMGGRVKGLDRAMERYEIRGVGAVGMSQVGNGTLWDEAQECGGLSFSGAAVFYLRGGYAPEKLNPIHRMMMKIMTASVSKDVQKKGEDATAAEKEMLERLLHGSDAFYEEDLDVVVNWFAHGDHSAKLVVKPGVTV